MDALAPLTTEKKRSMFSLNKHTISLKIACFLAGGVIGSHAAFLNVFFVSVGLPKFQAGIITGLTYALPILAGPTWGYLADLTERRRLILGVLCIGAAFPIFSTPWVAKSIYPPSHHQCSGGLSQSNDTITNSSGSHNFGIIDNAFAECESLKNEAINVLFWVLLVIMLIASVFLVPLQPYIDAIVMSAAKKAKADYGAQRIFCCIGIALVNYCAGEAAAHYRRQDVSPYSAVFFLLMPCVVLLIPVGCHILTKLNEDNMELEKSEKSLPDADSKDSVNFIQVFQLCRRFDVFLFLLTVLIVGMANAVILNFSYIYVTEVMHKTSSVMTLVVIVSTASEAVMFPFTTKIIQLLGTIPSIIVGAFAQAIRFLIMSFDIPFELFVALQAFSSLGFALSFAAMMEHTHRISPKKISITMSTIMTTLFFIVSNFVASIGGAKVYQVFGGKGLFLGQSMLCGGWALMIMLYYGLRAIKTRYSTTKEVIVPLTFGEDGGSP